MHIHRYEVLYSEQVENTEYRNLFYCERQCSRCDKLKGKYYLG